MPWSSEEKRKFKRINVSTLLIFKIIKPRSVEELEYCPAELINVSMGGMCFVSNIAVEPGIDLRIILRSFEMLSSRMDVPLENVAEEADFIIDSNVLSVVDQTDGSFVVRTRFNSFKRGNIAALYSFIEADSS